ncbi:MAG TPA: TPM domain-containing protein [bacterium]|nr:TPM domain-containing protein [bacterium]
MAGIREFLKAEDIGTVVSAIVDAEKRTSGEIRVRIESKAGKDPEAKARAAFEILGMRRTELKNGVLFYLSVNDRKFAIIGDDGINARVPEGFWNNVKDAVLEQFRKGHFAIGLTGGISLAAEKLSEFFPAEREDINELPDAVSFEEEK